MLYNMHHTTAAAPRPRPPKRRGVLAFCGPQERERAQRERLKALRDNNLDEYMKLINDTKNERIQARPCACPPSASEPPVCPPPAFTCAARAHTHTPPVPGYPGP